MNTICGADHPLITQDIIERNERLSQSTVQTVVRDLTNRGLLKVVGAKYSTNVLAREFSTTDKAVEEVLLYVMEEYKQVRNVISVREYFMALIEAEEDKSKRKQLVEELYEQLRELNNKE